ncbi:uncharacterized protein TRAVEDRAFT_112944 [Trametes versicolor FP-101664 SS1]|uniref:uncharacterized protein n=1 Tax=Trametes versicolor (strain FP-101664) TaxID=717944 RepID=UPI000462440F|nr:uncharacterized protein TRAVEDRAFT_112944 [Trametes versicolor FP-101664 SS1]EIW62517.1 hypothetical protein TRAVEDRAFT_112944 [Trametes versicolor FP-101664 SS1]
MSLPQATKDISSNPAAGAVTEPIDRQKLQTDVDRKLRLYGIFAAIKQSRLPTNDQIDSILSHLSHGSLSSSDSLSPDGQKLVQDSHDIIETLRKLVAEKNADELLQNFFWHTRDVNVDSAKKDPNEVLPVEGDKVRSDGQTAVQHLRTLLSLVFTNAEVRKLFSDFGVIGRDLVARGAEKLAEQARPDQEALRRIDEPAPEHKFISEGGREVGPNETPVPEVQLPGTDVRVAHHPRAEDPASGTAIKHGDEVKRGDVAYDEAQRKKDEFKSQAQTEANRQTEDVRQCAAVDEPVQNEADAQTRKQRLQGKWTDVKDTIRGRVPDEHKDRANEQTERVKNFLSDEYFPEERRDQFIFRLKKVVYECQSHQDYQGSMQWLLNFLEEYASHGRTIAGHGKDSHQQLAADPNLQTSLGEIRTLLERFANGRSLDTIGDAARALYDDAQKDEGLRHWFREVDEFVRKALLEPGYILDDQANERAKELRENGRQFYDDKYQGHFDNLISSVQTWFGAIADDPLNKQIGSNFATLAKDLFFDGDGNLKFKPELWADVRQQIIPGFIEQVGYVPIPRIEYTDEAVDLVIENLALSGKNLFPNLIEMEARNFAKLSAYKNIKDEFHHEFTLTLGQVQADMRDVAFYFRKKTGTPKLTDSGLADILLGGSGLTTTVHLVSADKDRSSVFKVKDVTTNIHTLKFSIRDSKHDTLYKIFGPLATGLVKKQLQNAVGQAVRTALEYVDGQLVAVRDQMAQARASEDVGRRDVLRQQLAARKQEADAAKAKKEARGAQFKVVTSPGDKILDAGHPDGWVNRTQERVQAAKTGEEWRSEAYSVV